MLLSYYTGQCYTLLCLFMISEHTIILPMSQQRTHTSTLLLLPNNPCLLEPRIHEEFAATPGVCSVRPVSLGGSGHEGVGGGLVQAVFDLLG